MAVAPGAPARPRPGGGRLFIIVGLLLAVLAGVGVFFVGGTVQGVVGGGGTDTVVFAKQSIPIRHQITLADLDTELVTHNIAAANNIYTKPGDLVNLIAEINISKNSVITSDMLARDVGLVPPGLAGATLPLASGYVALTIPTGEQQGVAGHITVGDYITVISSAQVTVFSSTAQQVGVPKVVSKTVFTNVRVIGVGPAVVNIQPAGSAATSAGTQGGATGGVSSSLTIELTQCDAEYFTWFLNNTTLKYTLEAAADYLKQPPTVPDINCPNIGSASGVSQKQVDQKYKFTSL